MKKKISGWGRYPKPIDSTILKPETQSQVELALPRGLGRSYGDAAQHTQVTLMTRLNRILAFDHETGVIRVEGGTSLHELLDLIVPMGWFVPVTPGTQFVTIGGAIASDIHGKNHHVDGSFGNHLQELKMKLADGSVCHCAPGDPLFCATVGGMGLTGIILEATFQLIPITSPYLEVTQTATISLEETFEELEQKATYSVAWIDSFKPGEGIVLRGEHTDERPQKEARLKKPISLPCSLFAPVLKPWSMQLFNRLYYWKGRHKPHLISHYIPFFYPLDAIANWNKTYGQLGFVQYQCVVPKSVVSLILESVSRRSYMTILKQFGSEGIGYLSFPKEGFTLAMDLVASSENIKLIGALDQIVLESGGRTYLAKDATLNPDQFRKMYPKYELFARIRSEVDPHKRFQSTLSNRLEI